MFIGNLDEPEISRDTEELKAGNMLYMVFYFN